MIEVRVFATLRQGRDKVTMLPSENFATAGDIIRHMEIPAEEVSILLINGFHKKKISCLYLLCRNFTANINEVVFRNLLYNLIRLRNLKGTVT